MDINVFQISFNFLKWVLLVYAFKINISKLFFLKKL